MTQRMPDQTWHEGAGMHLLERQMCKRFTMLNATITLSQAMFMLRVMPLLGALM